MSMPKELPCKFCNSPAKVFCEEGRYKVHCNFCGAEIYLKEYRRASTSELCDICKQNPKCAGLDICQECIPF